MADMQRCPSRSEYGVLCVLVEGHTDVDHFGWSDTVAKQWPMKPVGPQTADEWEAAAWELTGGLGLEVRVDDEDSLGPPRLIIDGDDMSKWFDARKVAIVGAWKAHRDGPAEPEPDVREVLKEQSADRLEDAESDGAMIDHSNDGCMIPDCGCTGEAHP